MGEVAVALEVQIRDLEASVRLELEDVQGRSRAAARDAAEAIAWLSPLRQIEREMGSHRKLVEEVVCQSKDYAARIEEHEFRLSTLRTKLDVHDEKIAVHDRVLWSTAGGTSFGAQMQGGVG